jgi:lysophospholipid acyltransferase (LPLAT)-like uncharacterized protein
MTEPGKSAATPDDHCGAALYDARPRALPFSKRMQAALIVNAAVTAMRLIGPTLRYEVLGWQQIERVHASGRRCVYSFWHRSIFLASWWWRHRGVVAMTSPNFDGQLLGRTLERIGFGTTPGSSSRGGMRALANLAKAMEQNHDAAWAADGPRGPRYVAKPGPVLLARRTGCPILPFHLRAEHAYFFEKSWDLFQLPLPFSRVILVCAPPIEVPRETGSDEIAAKHAELQRSLERVRDAAENWFTCPAVERQQERAARNS